jgi:hypothetical protein
VYLKHRGLLPSAGEASGEEGQDDDAMEAWVFMSFSFIFASYVVRPLCHISSCRTGVTDLQVENAVVRSPALRDDFFLLLFGAVIKFP